MASSTPFSILLIIWLSMVPPLCFSESRIFHFQDDARPIIPLDEFGFTSPGGLELILSHFSHSSPYNHPHPDLYHVGFFLCPRQSLTRLLQQLDNRVIECPLHSNIAKSPLTFRLLEVGRSGTTMFMSVDEDERYTLLLANCIQGMKISMDVKLEMFNLVGHGDFGRRNYLSAGEKPLPRFLFLFFSAYFTLTLLWTHLLLINKKRHAVFRVHFFILAVLILKAINLFCEAEKFSHMKLHGFLVDRFKVVFYALRSLTESIVFILTVLISTAGPWTFLRPFSLPEKDKLMVFFIIIPLQIIRNIAKVFVDETGPFGDYRFTWKVVFLVADLVCCFAWLIINDWSLKDMRSQGVIIMINLPKLSERSKEYFAVVKLYVFLTRAVLFAWDSTMIMISYKYVWITIVDSELVTLAFYAFMGFTFRPDLANKLYHYSLQIDEKDQEEGEAELAVTMKMVK